MEILSPGYWQEQDLELGTPAPLEEALSSTVWSNPDLLASQGEKPGPSSQRATDVSLILTPSSTHGTPPHGLSTHHHTAFSFPSDV